MHSCRELTGAEDPARLQRVLKEFFNKSGNLAIVVE
jgi:aspartyl aminopeptidase